MTMAFEWKLSLLEKGFIKNKILLIGIMIAVIAMWYGYNKIYKNSIVSLEQINTAIDDESVNVDVLKRVVRLQLEMENYRGYFDKETDISWLLSKVSKTASEAGLKIASLNYRPSGSLAPLSYNSISLAASGTFNQLGDFVSIIERSKEFMRIEKLSFKKNEQLLDAEMVISAYFWK